MIRRLNESPDFTGEFRKLYRELDNNLDELSDLLTSVRRMMRVDTGSSQTDINKMSEALDDFLVDLEDDCGISI